MEAVQRQTFRYFWEGAHPGTGLALDRRSSRGLIGDDVVAIGGSGFGIMCLIVAVERGWVTRAAALERLVLKLAALSRANRFHGAFSHFLHGDTGRTKPFMLQDDGGDLVETSMLMMGLLCARQYFQQETAVEQQLRADITVLWEAVEWNWYTRGGRDVLYWHWSPNFEWGMNSEIRGWNECLITYVLAAASPRFGIEPAVYHRGYAGGKFFFNGGTYAGIELALGPTLGGPLYFSQYSFCALDPRGLRDSYADYWQQCQHHVRINRAYCIANPLRHRGYGEDCWGLTASDDFTGYQAHAPDLDNGTISPTAALASMPYAPAEVLTAARNFLNSFGDRLWGPQGFLDAFCEDQNWFADTYLAIDQGPIVIMIENFRSGLLWDLFMSVPEVQSGLRLLGFTVS